MRTNNKKANLQLNKVAVIILALLAVGLFIWIIVSGISGPKNAIGNAIDKLLGNEKNPLLQNGAITVGGDLPFYEEFVKSYKQCKLSNDIECYCQITYPGTASGFVMELTNTGSKTYIRVNSGAEISGGGTFSTDQASLSPIDGATEIRTREEFVNEDQLYFKNIRDNIPFISLSTLGNKLSINDFTQVNKQFIQGEYLYSTQDVDGKDRISLKSGTALYKFDKEKVAIFPLESSTGLKRCSSPDKNIIAAINEFDRLVTSINSCITKSKLDSCRYVPVNYENFKLLLKDKKIILTYKNEVLRSSNEIQKELCIFKSITDTKLESTEPLSELNFNEYVEIDFHVFPNKLCFLPYTQETAQEKRLIDERQRISGNPSLIE